MSRGTGSENNKKNVSISNLTDASSSDDSSSLNSLSTDAFIAESVVGKNGMCSLRDPRFNWGWNDELGFLIVLPSFLARARWF